MDFMEIGEKENNPNHDKEESKKQAMGFKFKAPRNG
jgi:hypothetical protein